MFIGAVVDPILRVFLSGLVVFATTNTKKPADLQTILLNAADTPIATDGCPIPPHRPLLLHSQACKYPCKVERGLCACPVDRSLVQFFSEDQYGARRLLSDQMPPGEFENLDQCVHRVRGGLLKRFGIGSVKEMRTDCSFLAANFPPGTPIPVCPLVATRVDLVPDEFFACELMSGDHQGGAVTDGECVDSAPQPTSGTMTGDEIKFSPLSKHSWSWFPKPLATRELLKRAVPNLAKLVVSVRSFDAMLDYEVVLAPSPCGPCWRDAKTQYCVDLAIVNLPVPSLLKTNAYERCGELHFDREFELFEDLLAEETEIEDRRVPQGKKVGDRVEEPRSGWCESNLNYSLDRWFRTGGERKQCPPLSSATGK